jgi:hypothetical protein
LLRKVAKMLRKAVVRVAIDLIILGAVFVAVDVLVALVGYDSRDGDDWVKHRRI